MTAQPPHAITRQLCILANEKSGRGSGADQFSQIMSGFDDRGIAATLRYLKKGEDFQKIATEAIADGADTIVAAGGDGTMSGVSSALVGTGVPMGIMPLGTFNYFARSLGIPQQIEGALDVIAAGHHRKTNVGTINGQVFLNNASIGIYPQILKTRETTYARWGRSRIAAYWSVLRTMARLPRPLELDIEVDGQTEALKTPLAFVVCNAFQLRQMGLDGAECIEQGELALLIAQNTGRFGMLLNGIALLMGRAERNRNFRLICAPSIRLTPRRKRLLVARDGERGTFTGPFDLEMKTGALTVVAPGDDQDEVR